MSLGYGLLVLAQLVGLLLIPFGLPGIWLQVLALLGFAWWSGFAAVSPWTVVIVALIALVAEGIEFWLGGRFAERYGGSKRAAWGAILGGIVGAVMGVPVPIIGSVIGAFVGSFVGAMAFELTAQKRGGLDVGAATRVGWGALVGRLAATAVKSALGVVVAAVALIAAWGWRPGP